MNEDNNYEYLIVGAGLYGATIARLLTNNNHKCLVVDKHEYVGGMCHDNPFYAEDGKCMTVHEFGAHIFHTSDKNVIDFVSNYAEFNNYRHSVIAIDSANKIYHLPFNKNTFYDVFGTIDSKKILETIESEKLNIENPTNLEEQALSLVGKTLYEKIIKKYTQKQWNKDPKELPASIINRIPIRMNYNNDYFDDIFQGIPIGGYTKMISNILSGIDVKLNYNILDNKEELSKYSKVIYCGAIDELLDYELGVLQYRSLRFEHNLYKFDYKSSEGIAVTNLIDNQQGTRIIDHIWFTPESVESFIGNYTIKTLEIPDDWTPEKERYYSINDEENNTLYTKYIELLQKTYPNIIPGGRIGKYKYLDMDDCIKEAMEDYKNIVFNDKYIETLN